MSFWISVFVFFRYIPCDILILKKLYEDFWPVLCFSCVKECLLKLNVTVEFGEQVYFSSVWLGQSPWQLKYFGCLIVCFPTQDEVSSFCFLFCCWRAMCCSSCELTNIIITVEKEECGLCKGINTTWCAGYCCTQVGTLLWRKWECWGSGWGRLHLFPLCQYFVSSE